MVVCRLLPSYKSIFEDHLFQAEMKIDEISAIADKMEQMRDYLPFRFYEYYDRLNEQLVKMRRELDQLREISENLKSEMSWTVLRANIKGKGV